MTYSFLLPVSTHYLIHPLSPLPELWVTYKLSLGEPVQIELNAVPLELTTNCKDWTGLTEEIKQACRVNSRFPQVRHGKEMEPVEILEFEQRQVYKY